MFCYYEAESQEARAVLVGIMGESDVAYSSGLRHCGEAEDGGTGKSPKMNQLALVKSTIHEGYQKNLGHKRPHHRRETFARKARKRALTKPGIPSQWT